MAGYVVVRDGYVRTYAGVWFAVSGARPVLTDENGTLCCCGQGGCCDSCYREAQCNRPRCCYTVGLGGTGGDKLQDGYWYFEENHSTGMRVIMEFTQTGGGELTGGSFVITGTGRVVLSFDGNITCQGVGSVVGRVGPGRSNLYGSWNGQFSTCFYGNRPTWDTAICGCRVFPLWGNIDGAGNITYPFRPDGCIGTQVDGSTRDSLNLTDFVHRYYYRIQQCAERCTNDCTTCP